MEPNYFTCTLDQAKRHRGDTPFTNINDFVELQAREYPDLPAVGFYIPSLSKVETWKHEILTFKQVFHGSVAAAEIISNNIEIRARETVALLCPSTVDFLLTWLGLMRLGHSVLLIAPQCSPSAIKELCKQCEVSHLFYDDVYEDLAINASNCDDFHLEVHLVPFRDGLSAYEVAKGPARKRSQSVTVSRDDVAYLHHTSGTSTGMPKPIPQPHYAAAGACPRLDGSSRATFTTTPLYHGGIADAFRAWTSRALIWLFPGKEVPITADNVVKCLEVARNAGTPPIKYFSSVPYILQMMAEDDTGLHHLRNMDIVGVGGAALPKEVGDQLVDQGVSLVSRFGSAECGFLMSSHRDYTQDKEWQYLRVSDGEKYLRFEEREGSLSELVVLPGWPHMAKTNREDGLFATSDLFEPHSKIPNAWRYHSRADSQLTLATGKKFDPSPVESAIVARSSVLQDVLVFGNGQPYPGALLFRSAGAKELDDDEIVSQVAPKIETLNKDSQKHTHIPRSMLIPMPYSEIPLEKSSKGTIIRGKAEAKYAKAIQGAYETTSIPANVVPDDKLEDFIHEAVKSIIGTGEPQTEPLNSDTDLFAYGVDSVACVQIRKAVSRLLPETCAPLPLTIVQDSGSIRCLAENIYRRRYDQPINSQVKSDKSMMEEYFRQYSQLDLPDLDTAALASNTIPHSEGKIVVLTGSTGSLGSHLLAQLLEEPSISHVYLLLRGSTQQATQERVMKSLKYRKLDSALAFMGKMSIHTCNLSKPKLGLKDELYDQISHKVDIIYHLAWSVDFILPLHGFKQHFAGLQGLLSLVVHGIRQRSGKSEARVPHFIFCSSTAAVSSFPSQRPGKAIPEQVITDPKVSGSIGYSCSKWVAENVCYQIAQSYPELSGHVSVVRVGQLSGDTRNGIWNMSEAYPLMLSSAKATGCLPDLPDEIVDWLPVDKAAEAFVELGLLGNVKKGDGVRALHVLNPDRTTTWKMVLDWMRKDDQIEAVSASEWLERLEKLRQSQNESDREHPALKLLEFWKHAYGKDGNGDQAEHGLKGTTKQASTSRRGTFEMVSTTKAMPVMSEVCSVGDEYVTRLWDWIKRSS